MKRIMTLFLLAACVLQALPALASVKHRESKKHYRDLILRVRTEGEFRIPMPANGDLLFKYKMELDEPKWKEPVVADYPGLNVVEFWDKIFLKEGSHIVLNGEEIPLTCIHVKGRDLGKSPGGPTIPRYIITFFFVAKDWTCTGPLNPDYPRYSPRKEAWDTYLHYDVRDETIMLPSDAGLRYRWNEFEAVLVK